ncbi:MAG: HD domain-containing protein [Lachnospiraceae bacterium]|nr:HD domain-containing protein [Lachnospiraceae bacterium]
MEKQTAALMAAMIRYDRGDTPRIQHFVKVHDLAAAIGVLEGIDDETQHILETAAVLHDIGIHVSEEKYGSSSGHYQEIEGPAEAEKLLRELGGYSEAEIERVKYLIGHHHTYKDIDGMDYQILVEADFLVNLYESSSDAHAIAAARKNIFRTVTGLQFLDDMFAAREK